jgi:hypothetical protein
MQDFVYSNRDTAFFLTNPLTKLGVCLFIVFAAGPDKKSSPAQKPLMMALRAADFVGFGMSGTAFGLIDFIHQTVGYFHYRCYFVREYERIFIYTCGR